MTLQLEPLPGDVVHLLLRGATQLEPSAHTRQRLRDRLAAEVAAPSRSRSGLLVPGSRIEGFTGRLLRSRLLIGLLGFAVGAGTAAVARAPKTPTAPPSPTTVVAAAPVEAVPAPAVRLSAPLLAAISVAPAVSRKKIASRAAVPPRPGPASAPVTAAPRPAKSELRIEGDLLERGRIAMVRGDAEGALQAADEHASRFPRGKLAEEREALRIQALVAQDRNPEARAAFDAFGRAYPGSLATPALAAAVGR